MKFSIVKHRKWWFTLSAILVIASLLSIFTHGFNFGIDYTGGRLPKSVRLSTARG